MPVQLSNFVSKTPLIGSEWPPTGDWRSANNNSLGDWNKCCVPGSEIPQHLGPFGNSSLTMLTAQQPGEKIHPDGGYVSPKEDGRKSSEHTNSYDVSASQSPSNDGAQSDSTSDEHIDVECMTETEMDTDEKDSTIKPEDQATPKLEEGSDSKPESTSVEGTSSNYQVTSEPVQMPQMPIPVIPSFLKNSLPAPIPITPTQSANVERSNSPSIEEALLLTLSQQQFAEVFAEAAKIRKSSSESIGFQRSGTSAFLNIEPKEMSMSSANNNNEEAPASTVSACSTPTTTTSASFCRPPGLGPVALPPTQNGQTPMLVCPICGFMCPSKFHFNSHMNTHGDHQCSMCDYTSRTEGRLKKHMRESHTVEEQLRAGFESEPAKESASSPKNLSLSKDGSATSPINEIFNLSTTMASILDSTNNAVSSTSTTEQPSALSALTLDMSSTPSLLSTLAHSSFGVSALDQIKAISENPSFMPEGGINLASALGVVSNAIKGDTPSPEKQSNGECRRSSSGKIKIFKCKQCGHQSLSKDDQWAHARTHIPAEKQLNCQHCNFVTEYKHHLEYHYRNHIGSKPFQCKKCAYNCVNKSMLNSHMKSHTNHYQFRCMDCTYATKYCHSLKLHLKKYNHRRVPEGIEMSGGDSSPPFTSDATITFSPLMKQEIKTETVEPVTSIAQPFPFNPMMGNHGLNFANHMLLNKHLDVGLMGLRNSVMSPLKCSACDFVASSADEKMRHSMSHILNSSNVPTSIASLYNSLNLPSFSHVAPDNDNALESMDCDVKIDDDNITESHCYEEMDQGSDSAVSPTGSSQISSGDEETKKCKSLSLEQISARANGNNSPMSNDSAMEKDGESADDAPHSPSDTTSVPSPPLHSSSIVAPIPITPQPNEFLQSILAQASLLGPLLANRPSAFYCDHCKIPFDTQQVLDSHMRFHTPGNPFMCSDCQYQAFNELSFALHMYQARHQ
ncbi:C2H2-type domain-containing protein [Caenorhabditis elegans]|nr:C2H2-type domain-containing protein [Caenorhabditis elegans]CCD69457.1 C2H2-type domain-containing protein [Caenorhabditis elegans]|eukprot:NP_001041244.1 Hunchback-like protein [Caenorhabditis elegans]